MHRQICIPEELRPSSFLWDEEITPRAKALKGRCPQLCSTANSRLLDSLRAEADHLRGRDRNGSAVILIHLADVFCELGLFGPARECSETAKERFCYWPDIRHRHNCAVALYSTGLIHHLLGSENKALESYDEALEAFAKAKEVWIQSNAGKWAEQCDVAVGWIERLMNQLELQRREPPARKEAKVPAYSRIAAGATTFANEDFKGWVEIDETLAEQVDFALEVSGASMIDEGIPDGGLVFIEQRHDVPPAGQIVAILLDRVDNEATLKRFFREPDHIRLEPANQKYPYIVIMDKPDSVLEEDIRARYGKNLPARQVDIYSGKQPCIIGWYRGRVKEQVK